jgi:sporulation protein YtfJ
MEEHPIQGLMTTAMENIKGMVEANTIIGDPVKSPDGTVIIPVSKVGFGFAAGGSEFNNHANSDSDATLPFGGGSGGGVSITPIAFLIVSENKLRMVHLDQNTHIYEKMIDYAPQVIEKVQEMLKDTGRSQKKEESEKKPSRKEEPPSPYDI